MKSLKDTINYSAPLGYIYYLRQLREVYGDHEPHDIENLLENGVDCILETLNSHDTKLLTKKLSGVYNDARFALGHGKNKFAIQMVISDATSLQTDEKFLRVLDFYGYYVTEWHDDYITIEPKYSDNVTKQLLDNHGICYHFTDNKSAESILKNGLRCREGLTYRDFPARIYLYIAKTIGSQGKLYPEIAKFAKRIVNVVKLRVYGLAVLKIDLNNANVDVYKDTLMPDGGACFTYHNIPPEYITKLNITL